MTPPDRTLVRRDSEAESTQSQAARILSGCLEAIENFTRDRVEEACHEHPARAQAIRERMKTLRSAGLAARVDRSTSQSASWAGAPTLETTEHFEPIGPYQPLKELGRGGQALVYLAEDLRLHRPVALKILRGFGPLSEDVMRRFRREAEVASKLDHPGICAVYDAGVERGIPFIAMRYVEGESLAAKIAAARTNGARPGRSDASHAAAASGARSFVAISNGESAETETAAPTEATTLPTGQNTRAELLRVVKLIEKAARALHAAHEAGIVHRDVKPGNILVTPSAEPVLLDFGLAGEVAGELSAFTRTGELFGTPAYMSPEQLLAKRIRLDRRTDVYSLGATLYECVTLRRPFEAPTREALYHAIEFKDPPNPRKLNRLVPPDLKVVLDKALEKDRDRRYPTAEAFADDLQRVRTGEPIAARPVSPAGRALRWARRRPVHAALLLTLLIGLPLVTGLAAYVIRALPDIRTGWDRQRAAKIEGYLEQGFSELAEHENVTTGGSAFHDMAYGRTVDATACGRAIELFDRALEADDAHVEAIAGKALALCSLKQYQSALDFLEDCRGPEQKHPVLLLLRRTPLYRLGRHGELVDLEQQLPEPARSLDHFLAALTLMSRYGQRHDKAVFLDAADHLRRAVLAAPRVRPMYLFQLAHACGLLENTGNSESRLVARALQSACPKSGVSCFWIGYALNNVDPERALVALLKGVERRPNSPRAHTALGHIYGKIGDVSKQLAHYETVIRLDPRSAHAHSALAIVVHNRLGDLARSIRLFHKAIELDGKRAVFHANLANAYNSVGKLSEALVECGRATELDATCAMAHQMRGVVLGRLGKVDEGIASLRTAIRLDETLADAHHQLGILLNNENRDYVGAVACFLKANQLRPRFAPYYYNLGNAYLSMGDLHRAIEAFRAALEFAKSPRASAQRVDVALTLARLGQALYRSGRADEALRLLEDAVRRFPRSGEVHLNLGVFMTNHARKYARAVVHVRKAIELGLDTSLAHSDLAALLANMGRYLEGLVECRRAIERLHDGRSRFRVSDYYLAHGNLGGILGDIGHAQESRAVLESCMALPVERPSGLCCSSLGVVLRELGEFRGSLGMFQEAHETGPGIWPSEGWDAHSKKQVDVGRRLVELQDRLDAAHDGFEEPEKADDRALIGVIFRAREHYATAARLFAEAFASDPTLATPIKGFRTYRFDAARAAVLAGAGRGASGAALTMTERAEFRRQALAWLEEELTYLVENFIPPRDAIRATQPGRYEVLRELRRWEVHVDFA
ncbi:MAG: tetratricopeptide repeat protein, partial [Polyangiaceae bacterium]|nr:tetratricopeptide repeat protein [Polyangiaceae bacterium]